MTDHGMLDPGSHRASDLVSDAALCQAMVRVEMAWLRALASSGAVKPDQVEVVIETVQAWQPDVDGLAERAELTGNVVVPLVEDLRNLVGKPASDFIHRGLTSQDVLDTALMVVSESTLERISVDLRTLADGLATLAQRHRADVMIGRTLTQPAVPITFGLKAARWLWGVVDAVELVSDQMSVLPVQCGGAAGTLSRAAELIPDPVRTAQDFAADLGLVWPGMPWHTSRAPVTRLGHALVQTCDSLGVIANDLALLTRPEFGELREGPRPERGGSSTMPHKQNPVGSILVRSIAMQAPQLGAQLHLCAALAVDERPDGALHAEWPTHRRLLALTATASSLMADVVSHLEVDSGRMTSRARELASSLLSEKFGSTDGVPEGADPASYLGASSEFIDRAVARWSAHLDV